MRTIAGEVIEDKTEGETKQKIEGDLGITNKDVSTNPNESRRMNLLNRLEASSTL